MESRVKYALFTQKSTFCGKVRVKCAVSMFFGLQICDERIVINLLPCTIHNFLQFASVGGDQFLFKLRCLEFHGDIVVVRGDQTVAALKMRNRHCLSF